VYGAIEYTALYNSQTGEKLVQIPHPDTIRLSRRRMRKLCSEAIDVQYGRTFKGVSYEGGKVQARFEDGEVVEGDLLIGADGTRSVAREVLLGVDKAERTLCRLVLTTTVVRYGDAEVARMVRSLSTHGALGYQEGMFNMIASVSPPLFTKIR
jgi:2-polyprenyl-6-methoxyphenol hydroxylase-like FAD-dependent oxidoreductase